MNKAPRSYTTVVVAAKLGVSLPTVQRWVDTGQLRAWKTLGGHRRIDAESAETLFRNQAALIGAANAVDDETAAGSKPLSVMIVDDLEADRELILFLVREALPQARIQLAENGFQALAVIARSRPDIVVTDILMPHMNGIELIRHLMADDTMSPQLLVAISALSPAELAEQGRLPANVLYFAKPLQRMQVVAELQLRTAAIRPLSLGRR